MEIGPQRDVTRNSEAVFAPGDPAKSYKSFPNGSRTKGDEEGKGREELDGFAVQFYPCRKLRVEKRIEKGRGGGGGGGESRIGRKDGRREGVE